MGQSSLVKMKPQCLQLGMQLLDTRTDSECWNQKDKMKTLDEPVFTCLENFTQC